MYSSLGFQDVNRPTTCYSSVFCTNAWYYYPCMVLVRPAKQYASRIVPPAGYREVGMQMHNSVAVSMMASVFQDHLSR